MDNILITGGTGFLGKRLGKLLKENGYMVTLAGRNNKLNQYARQFSGCDVLPLDVSHIESVRDVVNEIKPDTIIHAAATKFVDLSEIYSMEAIDVNVVGSQNVARVAIDKKIRNVIGISTDKASPPVRNTYGLTKALMERMFCNLDKRYETNFMCVRYGNVAWSTGSVLCVWKKMLEGKGMIGTTGPEMYRFFFTVDEAVQLVLSAMENIDQYHGKILSRKMKSAQMIDIIKIWTELKSASYQVLPGRPGERDEEFLFGEMELPYTELIDLNGKDHYLISVNEKVVNPVNLVLSSRNAEKLNRDEIISIISNPPEEEN